MIHADPVISIGITAIYDEEGISHYELIEVHHANNEEIQSFFIDKKYMKQYLKDLIRSL